MEGIIRKLSINELSILVASGLKDPAMQKLAEERLVAMYTEGSFQDEVTPFAEEVSSKETEDAEIPDDDEETILYVSPFTDKETPDDIFPFADEEATFEVPHGVTARKAIEDIMGKWCRQPQDYIERALYDQDMRFVDWLEKQTDDITEVPDEEAPFSISHEDDDFELPNGETADEAIEYIMGLWCRQPCDSMEERMHERDRRFIEWLKTLPRDIIRYKLPENIDEEIEEIRERMQNITYDDRLREERDKCYLGWLLEQKYVDTKEDYFEFRITKEQHPFNFQYIQERFCWS